MTLITEDECILKQKRQTPSEGKKVFPNISHSLDYLALSGVKQIYDFKSSNYYVKAYEIDSVTLPEEIGV